jgi:hypothetical protein
LQQVPEQREVVALEQQRKLGRIARLHKPHD